MSLFAATLQEFFTERLIAQRRASPNTVGSYRDALCMLLRFVEKQSGKSPATLTFDDLDAPVIGAFLEHLERERGSAVSTRNTRLAAIRSLFRFAALRHPEHAAVIQRVLAMPPKRADKAVVSFLSRSEVEALLMSVDRSTQTGRRDHVMILVALQTGLRVSELISLRGQDIQLGIGAHLHCRGKGRKDRVTPLLPQTVKALRAWMAECECQPADPLFSGPRGAPLSRDAVRRVLDRHLLHAAQRCPSLRTKRVSPHVLRHTCAMQLLEANVDQTVVALWLGHETVRTTQIYIHGDLRIKERALARTTPPKVPPGRYRPPDPVLAFLESL
jgi:site-specific recombinase XerD